jgi:hypothetical protein
MPISRVILSRIARGIDTSKIRKLTVTEAIFCRTKMMKTASRTAPMMWFTDIIYTPELYGLIFTEDMSRNF